MYGKYLREASRDQDSNTTVLGNIACTLLKPAETVSQSCRTQGNINLTIV